MHVDTFGRPGDPVLLLLHGGGVAGWMWKPFRAHLGAGFQIVVPDLPGHDRSADSSYRAHADAVGGLERLLEPLVGGGSDAVAVAGFSLGAQLAVLLAVERPDLVRQVVAISAEAVPMKAGRLVLGVVRVTAGLARRPAFARLQARSLGIPEDLVEDFVRTSASISRDTLVASVRENIGFAVPAGWAAFPGRALVVVGDRERPIMRESADALHTVLLSSELHVVNGSGHDVPFKRPDWLADRLRSWLALEL